MSSVYWFCVIAFILEFVLNLCWFHFISSWIVSLKIFHFSHWKVHLQKLLTVFNSPPSWTWPKLILQYLWPWTFMILLVIIIAYFMIFKLELWWKTMFFIACINHMSCLSTMTTVFGSILSSITIYVSINHFLWLITKKLSLLLCTERTNYMLLRTNMIRWTKILWRINDFGHDKCSNQSSQIRALIPYYENKKMNRNEQRIWEWKYSLCFSIYW